MNQPRRWFCAGHPCALWVMGVAAAIVFFVGMLWDNDGMLGGGAAVLCLVAYAVGNWVGRLSPSVHRELQMRGPGNRPQPAAPDVRQHERQSPPRSVTGSGSDGPPRSSDALVDDLLSTARYALLLRPEMKEHLSQSQVIRAIRQLDEAMSLVPAGRVLLGQLAEQVAASCGAAEADPKTVERNMVHVEPVYLDRFTVSNQQFQQFVDAGGYERLEYWHEEALPALLDFVDQTGQPGPRFWCDGHSPCGEEYLPVVGVSWYEAWAYARWVGKRLPTDAEWTKAGAWPVESSPGRIAQRRYPWGESFDLRRANLWSSGRHQAGDVDEFPAGVSVGGIYQLVGNVWEWTDSPLSDTVDRTYHVPETYKSIRGGAFDTYFESQATCHFASGDHPLARRRNIGFRLALPMADLDATVTDDSAADADGEQPPEPMPHAEGTECKEKHEIAC
jgi:iron(II)-dependent oxidoreductase